MSEFVALLHQVLRYSHIILGFAGLILFWVPVFANKGGRLHRRSGMVFAAIALWVGTTGLVSSIWAFAAPEHFINSLGHSFPDKAAPYVAERNRFLFSLLAFLSIGTVSGVVMGVALAWTKSRHEGLRNIWVVGSLWATIAIAGGLTAFGAWNLWLGATDQHLLSASATRKYWVSLILGLIGVWGTWADLQYVRKPVPAEMAWFYQHMNCMLSTGIAFYTAFLVFGANRLYEKLGIELKGAWNLLPWIVPTVVGQPVISWWVARYRRKFEGGGDAN